MALIDDIKTLTNSTDTTTLNILINQSKSFAVDYCNLDEYDTDLDNIVMDMVCEKFNKLYSAGISSQNYSSISQSFNDDFSPTIYRQLRKHRLIRSV